MHVVEGAHQLYVFRKQHAVAEHVARHVAAAETGEVLVLNVLGQFAEMALHRFPGALGGDAHLLVVVARRAARCEGIVKPEAVVLGHAVGDVREGRRALVGGDHQIRVVLVMAHHIERRHDLAGLEVVRQVEKPADEGPIAGDAFLEERLPAGLRGRRSLDHETALRPDRHDDRVLHLLGLDETEDLRAEVLAPIRPPETAARDLAEAQMHAFDARAVDEDLAERPRQGQFIDIAGVELEGNVALRLAVLRVLVEIRSQGRLDHIEEPADNSVLVQVTDLLEILLDLAKQTIGGGLGTFRPILLLRRVETGVEQLDQAPGDLRIAPEGPLHIGLAKGNAGLE